MTNSTNYLLIKLLIKLSSDQNCRLNMAATTRLFGSLREMCIFYLCYILLSGFSYKETTLSTGGISCSFALAKTLTRVELPAIRGGHRKFDTRSKTPLAIRLMKTLQLTQYCSLAVLVLLAGDIEPNPGWNRHHVPNRNMAKLL